MKVPAWILICGLVAALVMPLGNFTAQLYELVAIGVILPALVYYGSTAYERRPDVGVVLGNVSYALYLVHFPVLLTALSFIQRGVVKPGFLLGASFILLCLAVAFIIDAFVDPKARTILARLLNHR